jgi:predicted TIM-barrel fold metal-dependent hydrolase
LIKAHTERIDMFTHIMPPKYHQALFKLAKPTIFKELDSSVMALTDLDKRFKIMDRNPEVRDLLTLGQPALEDVVDAKQAAELAKIANDEMAEFIEKYPSRFIGAAACVPMNDTDLALKEIERAAEGLRFKGIQIATPSKGRPLDNPEFMPIYELMSKYDLPIWIHPTKEASIPDYEGEEGSKYNMYSRIGWPYETSKCMARLVYSGIFNKFPKIKFIMHHGGAMIPFFASRLSRPPGPWLKKAPLEYFKMFYVDTALGGYAPSIRFSLEFFGEDHIVFGTDSPFGGDIGVGRNIDAIESLSLGESITSKIFEENAKRLINVNY